MGSKKNTKVYGTILGIAALAFGVDRLFLQGSALGPSEAKAAEQAAPSSSRALTPKALPASALVANQIDVKLGEELVLADVPDAFDSTALFPEAEVEEVLDAAGEPVVETSPDKLAIEQAITDFKAKHTLTTVMREQVVLNSSIRMEVGDTLGRDGAMLLKDERILPSADRAADVSDPKDLFKLVEVRYRKPNEPNPGYHAVFEHQGEQFNLGM